MNLSLISLHKFSSHANKVLLSNSPVISFPLCFIEETGAFQDSNEEDLPSPKQEEFLR